MCPMAPLEQVPVCVLVGPTGAWLWRVIPHLVEDGRLPMAVSRHVLCRAGPARRTDLPVPTLAERPGSHRRAVRATGRAPWRDNLVAVAVVVDGRSRLLPSEAVINDDDIEAMVEACRQLPEPAGNYLVDDYLTNLMATVVDFQAQTTAVERALEHFATRVRPSLVGLDDLVDLLEPWPADQAGNTALARHLWGYDLWTRAQMLRGLVAYFASIGVTDQHTLERWAATATFERDFKGRVPGLGPAVFQWLVMRQGVDTVKPDVHVHRFVARVVGRQLGDADVVTAVEAAARRLGRPAHRLDWAIWETGRAATSNDSAGPDRRPGPSAPVVTVRGEGASDVCTFVDDDAGYIAWLAAHPTGYVLNHERSPSARYLVLHRADCWTIAPRDRADTRTWTIAYPKTCSATRPALTIWAEANTRRPPSPCGTCQPAN